MAISVSIPPEDNAAIFRDNKLALALQQLEEDEVQNLEKKEKMIVRGGDFATVIQQQEED